MLIALLSLLVAQSPVPSAGGPIFSSPALSGGGLALEFAGATGRGMGAPCACSPVFTAKGEAIFFANSTVAECYSNDGQTLTQCAVNAPRVSSGTATSTQLGIWKEPLRNNIVLHSRDLSQAVWVKTNMTCTRTATGMRGDTNGATRCTATAANATVLQATVTGAATRNTSMHVKTVTLAGSFQPTRDGATFTTATGLSSSLWKRTVSEEVPGCAGGNCSIVAALTSGIANPTIGFRLTNSGDVVDIDFVQDEETETPSSPIVNAGTALFRDLDVIDLPFAYTGVAGVGLSSSAEYVTGGPWTGGSTGALVATNGALGAASFGATYWLLYSATLLGGFAADSAGVASAGLASYNPGLDVFPTSTISYAGGIWHTGSKWQVCQVGLCGPQSGSSTFGTPAFTRILLGRLTSAAANQFSGVIKGVCVDPSGRCVSRFDATQSVWIGDSIPGGTGSLPLDPVLQLRGLTGKWVTNAGVGGNTTAQCAARYTSTYQTGYPRIIWLCGVNSMIAGVTGAQAATDTQAVLADARSRGYKVIVVGITPWKGYVSWTAGRQTETDAYNSAMSTWASANGATYVSPASLGGQGGDPNVMLLTYDSGDGLHPNSTGAGVLASLVNAVFP